MVVEQTFQPCRQNNFICVWINSLRKDVLFWEKIKKIRVCSGFWSFPENFSDISDKIFQQVCIEKFSKYAKQHFQGKRCFFAGKISFLFNSGFWAKMFTSLGKTFKQAYQKCNLAVQWSILKTFLKWMIHFFSFHFENWAKSIRFWRKNFGKVVKTRCSE